MGKNEKIRNKTRDNVKYLLDKSKKQKTELSKPKKLEEKIPATVEANTQGDELVMNSASYSLGINIPKKIGKGEDSDPLLYRSENHFFVVGVFDGMGGSGATEYKTDNGSHTGAYIASRRVMMSCLDYLQRLEVKDIDVTALITSIKVGLDKCVQDYNIKPSGLRSAIIRTLPTTLAITTVNKDGQHFRVKSYWCGDSRNYILTAKGLLQVSTDHLTTAQDPLENLRNDESLSNCICHDKSFTIESRDCGIFTEPIIILSATDGCFGYLKSPMHFEYLLLKTMQESTNMDDWKNHIEEWLKPISGDDFSLGLMTIESDLTYWKKKTINRLSYIEKTFIKPIEKKENAILKAKQNVMDAEEGLYDGITSLWETYKQDFLFEGGNAL